MLDTALGIQHTSEHKVGHKGLPLTEGHHN